MLYNRCPVIRIICTGGVVQFLCVVCLLFFILSNDTSTFAAIAASPAKLSEESEQLEQSERSEQPTSSGAVINGQVREMEKLRLFYTPDQRDKLVAAPSDELQVKPDMQRHIVSSSIESASGRVNNQQTEALAIHAERSAIKNDQLAKEKITGTHEVITYNGYIRQGTNLVFFVNAKQLLNHPKFVRQEMSDQGEVLRLWLLDQDRIDLHIGQSVTIND